MAAQRVVRYVAGHTGLVGSALMRRWAGQPFVQLMTATHAELELTDPVVVHAWLQAHRPQEIILAAGKVGGIAANASEPVAFLYENLMMETNVIVGAWKAGVKRLVNFGSSCMYPKQCPQPMRPEQLMTGPMEPISAPYAMAKWVGLSLCQAYNRQHGTRFLTAIPCTVYGPGDQFDLHQAHVLSALMRRCHEAKAQGQQAITLWGTGTARREFVYADDLAEACEVVLDRYDAEAPINIGSGHACTIRELAELVADVVGFRGDLRWDASQPDGAPEKRLDASAIHQLGWAVRTPLRRGLEQTYQWMLEHKPFVGAIACAFS